MIFKRFFRVVAVLLVSVLMLKAVQIKAEEIEEELPATIVVGECVYGSATYSPEEIKVGDVVTVYPSAQVFCVLKEVKVNGTPIVKNENGEYQFVVVQGENIITVECQVNKEDMQIVASLIDNAQKGNWEEIFSFNNIFNLISWAISIFLGSGFLLTLLKNKKIKSITSDEIAAKMNTVIPETVTNVVLNQFQPIIDAVNKAIKDVNESCDSLVRCMMLMQEGTPEARLAVSKELAGLNRIGTADIEKQVKEIISQEVAKIEELKQQKQDALNILIEKNNAIVEKPLQEEEKIDDELKGRI